MGKKVLSQLLRSESGAAKSLQLFSNSRLESNDNADSSSNSSQFEYQSDVETSVSNKEDTGSGICLKSCSARIPQVANDSNYSSFDNFQNETCWTNINNLSLLDSITAWSVLEPNVPHAAVTRLLQSLNHFHPELPETFHTLLPPPKLQYKPMGEGLYVHLPNWIASLNSVLSHYNFSSDIGASSYNLVVNIDGLPLFSSTPNYKVYPILITLHKVKMRPLCVGIYCTEISFNREMPSTYEFLKRFLDDVKYLLTHPLVCDGCTYHLKDYPIFVCDAPARSSLKAIKAHTGYYSCERCDIKGEYHDARVCMLGTHGKRRSDSDFSLQVCKDHHKGFSALHDFGVPMVKNFVLDYMHLACLGITKRLLLFWKGILRYTRLAFHVLNVRLLLLCN